MPRSHSTSLLRSADLRRKFERLRRARRPDRAAAQRLIAEIDGEFAAWGELAFNFVNREPPIPDPARHLGVRVANELRRLAIVRSEALQLLSLRDG